jgi:hypothetical protein
MDGSQSFLSEIMTATTEMMQADLKRIRASINHAGNVGASAEEIVARFLNERLPSSVRAVSGQAVDSTGQRSKQLDVIVYDTVRTPLLFSSPGEGQYLVPIEGVVAVIEVKAKLTRKELWRSVENCASVKRLQREALVPEPITRTFKVYGRQWRLPPVYYSVFGFDSDGLYAEVLNDEMGQDLQLHEQIDTIVCLDRGLCLNVALDVSGSGNDCSADPRFAPMPDPDTLRVNVETSSGLVVWYSFLASTVMSRTPGPPIDVTRYLGSELQLSGKVGGGAAARAFYDRARDRIFKAIGLDASIGRKYASKEPMSPNEIYELCRHPALHLSEDASPDFQNWKQSANEQSRQDWLARWFPGRDPDETLEEQSE